MRLEPARRDDFSEADQAVFDQLDVSRAGAIDLHRIMANAPNLALPALEVTRQLRASKELPAILRELAVLRTAQLNQSDYLFIRHSRHALAAGLSSEQVAAMAAWKSSALFDPVQAAVLALADALHAPPFVAQHETWSVLTDNLTDRAIAELIIGIGMYHLASRFVGAVEIDLEEWYGK